MALELDYTVFGLRCVIIGSIGVGPLGVGFVVFDGIGVGP